MLEMPEVFRHADWSMAIEHIAALIRNGFQGSTLCVQSGVCRVAANCSPGVGPGPRSRVTHTPRLAACPERGDAQLRPARAPHDHVEVGIGEGVVVGPRA